MVHRSYILESGFWKPYGMHSAVRDGMQKP